MFKKIILILCICFLAISCQKEQKQDPFEISTNRIGLLTNETQLYQLDSIFSQDSIVKRNAGDQYISAANEIEIYKKNGDRLLVLEPAQDHDSTSTIENIQIIDPRYKTTTGLSSNSYFKDIKDKYTISKINNTLSTAVIFVDSIHAYLTIDKKELPAEFNMNTDVKIEANKIPDSAKIKHFWISWDTN